MRPEIPISAEKAAEWSKKLKAFASVPKENALGPEIFARYHSWGLSAIPTTPGEKRPIGSWTAFQKQIPTAAQSRNWGSHGRIGIVCGKVSGGLEVLDFDQSGVAFAPWKAKIPDPLFARLTVETSPSGGWHVFYRCNEVEIPGNTKLAASMTSGKPEVLIETRAEGGFIVCAPSHGYMLIQGGFDTIPDVTAQEREQMLDAAKSLDECGEPPVRPARKARATAAAYSGDSVADRYSREKGGSLPELLEKHGWTEQQTIGDNTHFTRPGKREGTSATWNGKTFFVFSDNAPPFKACDPRGDNKGYSAFSVYSMLEHGGDMSAAAKHLKREFGVARSPVAVPVPEQRQEGNGEIGWDDPVSEPDDHDEGPEPDPDDAALLRSALAAISPELECKDLHRIACAWKHERMPMREMVEWARRSPKFKPSEIEKIWVSPEPQNLCKAGTIFHFAKESGWVRPRKARKRKTVPGTNTAADGGGNQEPVEVDETIQELETELGPPLRWKHDKDGVTTGVFFNLPFVAAYHGRMYDLLFDPAEGRFYGYDKATGIWSPVTDQKICVNLADTFLCLASKMRRMNHEELELVATSRYETTLRGVCNLLKGTIERREAFRRDRDRPYIHCQNGILDLAEMELAPFAPDYYSRNQIPIMFDPNADCPEFKAFLDSVLDEDDVDLLQRWSGTVALGGNPTQTVLLMTGLPGTGKGTFSEIIEEVIGRRNTTELRTSLLLERFETYRFIGKTLLTGKDVPGKFLQQKGAANIKKMVGHDWITAEKKNKNDVFDVRGEWAVLITSNERLHVSLEGECDVGAWRRRLAIVEYSKPPTYKKRIENYSLDLVRREGSGILNWVVEGAMSVIEEREREGNVLQLSPRQRARVEALLAESISLEAFLLARVAVGDGNLSVQEIVSAYFKYCEGKNWRSRSTGDVERLLPDLMLRLFSSSKSGSVIREGKNNKGFRNVLFTEETK